MQKITIELELASAEDAIRVLAALNGASAVDTKVVEEKKAPKKTRRVTAKPKAAAPTEPAVSPTPPAEVPKAEVKTEAPKAESASKYSIEDVRAMVKQKAPIDREAVVAALKKQDAANVTELKVERYDALMADLSLI